MSQVTVRHQVGYDNLATTGQLHLGPSKVAIFERMIQYFHDVLPPPVSFHRLGLTGRFVVVRKPGIVSRWGLHDNQHETAVVERLREIATTPRLLEPAFTPMPEE